jgi:hypothetical protein
MADQKKGQQPPVVPVDRTRQVWDEILRKQGLLRESSKKRTSAAHGATARSG